MFQILNPPPTSLPIPSLWVIPVHQPQASCILHRTWTGDLFLIWYYTCFNAILPNHPTLSLSHRVQNCSIHLCLFCCLAYRVIVTIFLIPYICVSILYWCFSFWLASLCIMLVGMQTSTALWRTVWRFLKKLEIELPMTQQSHCWAYTLRKPELKETCVPQCSSQCCL